MPKVIIHSSEDKKIYHTKYSKVYILIGFILLCMGAYYLFGKASIEAALPFFFLGGVLLYLMQALRIVTSPQGISYYNLGLYALHAPWPNIDYIGQVPLRLIGNQRCIVLREAVITGWGVRLAWMLPENLQQTTIPLIDLEKIQELEKDIRQYAPEARWLM